MTVTSDASDTVSADRVARIRLNRPDKRHALGSDHVQEIIDQIHDAQRAGIEVVVLESSGPIFCAGADRKDVAGGSDRRPAVELLNEVIDSGLYWVAAVQGGAVGAGVSLTALCHYVIAAPGAWFSLPEYHYKIMPTLALELVDAVSGPRFAWGLASVGGRADAQSALTAGFVNEIVPDGDLIDAAVRHAQATAAIPGLGAAAARWWRTKLPAQFAGADHFG